MYDDPLKILRDQLKMLHDNPLRLDEKDKLNNYKRAVKEIEEEINAINVVKHNEIMNNYRVNNVQCIMIYILYVGFIYKPIYL